MAEQIITQTVSDTVVAGQRSPAAPQFRDELQFHAKQMRWC
jgi:hypothetical protein